ncbi:MAG: hypothetical protein K0R31_249 [Clostridiales bacterium]|nr:hypothetical protein [Clostridiales bacterium]
MEQLIKRCHEFLVSHINEASMTEEEKNYRVEHSLRVANFGKYLAERENADSKIVVISCLLHDVGKFDTEDNMEHGRVSARIARDFLNDTTLSQKEIEDICYAIAVHVDGKCGYDYEETLESKIVSDSDNIDRFGALRIHQTMAWGKECTEGTIQERIEAVRTIIRKRMELKDQYNLETQTGDKIWKDYLKYQIEYFERYLKELEITTLDTL